MVKVLLDAETVVAAIKGRLPVVMRLARLKPDDVAVSAVSRIEIEAALRSQPRRNNHHEPLLKSFFASVRQLDIDAVCAQQAATLGAYLHQAETPLAPFDLLVAATAVTHRRVLITPRTVVFLQVPQLDCENWLQS